MIHSAFALIFVKLVRENFEKNRFKDDMGHKSPSDLVLNQQLDITKLSGYVAYEYRRDEF